MTFEEWWKTNTRPFLHNEGIAKMTARAGWDAAIANSTTAAPVAQPDDAYIKALEAERDQLRVAYEQEQKSLRDMTEKVLPNVRKERDQLHAEVEALRAEHVLCMSLMDDKLTQLRTEVEALRADAERYQWLRNANRETELLVYSKGCELDDSIDAARNNPAA